MELLPRDGVRGLIGVLKVRGSRVENRRRMDESVRPAAVA